MVWVSWHLRPSWFPKTHRKQSSPSRDTLHMDGSQGRAHPDNLIAASDSHQLQSWTVGVRPEKPSDFFSIRKRGNFLIIACDMHRKTFSRNDLKHAKDPTNRFQSSCRFILLDGLLDATLNQNVKWQFRLHAVHPFLIVSSAAIGWKLARWACERKNMFSIALARGRCFKALCNGTEEVVDSPFWRSLKLRNWSSLVGLSWRCYGMTWIWEVCGCWYMFRIALHMLSVEVPKVL